MSTTDNDLAQALYRTLYDAGVSFESNKVIPLLTATVRAAGFRRQGPVTDEQADAASLAFHEFVFGPQVPMSERARGITRQAWKAALDAARNA